MGLPMGTIKYSIFYSIVSHHSLINTTTFSTTDMMKHLQKHQAEINNKVVQATKKHEGKCPDSNKSKADNRKANVHFTVLSD